jgi:hypothetical protein
MPKPAGYLPFTRFLSNFHGVFVIVAAIAVAIVGWNILRRLALNIHEHPDTGADLPETAEWLIRNRALFPFFALPPILLAGLGMVKFSARGGGCLLVVLAAAWVLVLLGLTLFTFISYVTPLYQYQPL